MTMTLNSVPLYTFCSDPYYEDAWWAKLGYTSGRIKTTLENLPQQVPRWLLRVQ